MPRWMMSLVCVLLAALTARAEPPTFRVVFDEFFQPGPYTGQVFVVISVGPGEPRRSMTSWYNPPRIFRVDAVDVPPGGAVVVDGAAVFYPEPMSALPPGQYSVQAVARVSQDSPNPGQGEGDLFSRPVRVTIPEAAAPGPAASIELKIKGAHQPPAFTESERCKLVEIVSPSLSEFYGRRIYLRAGVVLPDEWYSQPERRWPVLYQIGGFGGTHWSALAIANNRARGATGSDVLLVVPDPSCLRGHSVFANSANNGPWGDALVRELIPEVERRFRGPGEGRHRYVTGASSGGWSSLWLVLNYPEEFRACYSHCPDPVDFRDFQQINLYAPGASMYRDQSGARRPLARDRGLEPVLWYDDFVRREEITNPGGQIASFEAVFSPRGEDGEPVPLFDRGTGAVNPATAKEWEAYDIRLFIERNIDTLRDRIAGKINVYAGGADTYYLEGAAELLKESAAELGLDAVIRIVPNMVHTTFKPAVGTMYGEIMQNWLADHPEHAPADAAPAAEPAEVSPN